MSHSVEQAPSSGFPPIARKDARILVLGSLPSEASLRASEYYAHPRNAFWKIMKEIAGASGSYEDRCQALMDSGIAVWDVLASSVRPGSLDADIRLSSAVANDFVRFFAEHARLQIVCFNGRKAEAMFRRFVMPSISTSELVFAALPSTSPAHASVPVAQKLAIWRGIIEPHIGGGERK
jgi:hypoxanthine-DNA glycosylase